MRDLGLISFLAAQRWALHAPVLEAACGVIARHAAGERAEPSKIASIVAGRDDRQSRRRVEIAKAGQVIAIKDDESVGPVDNEPEPYTMAGSVAVVPISGVLSKYADMVNGVSQPTGMTSDQVAANIYAAAEDSAAESILLDIDSPGGTVAGGNDMHDAIAQVRAGGMPVVALSHDNALSAAYWLACCADELWLTPQAEVGSIGVYSVISDYSRADANRGIAHHVIASGKDKGVGAGSAPILHDQIAVIKEDVDRMAMDFKAAVADSRGLSAERMEELATGRTFVGQHAVDVGLADGVTTVRELVKAMQMLTRSSRS